MLFKETFSWVLRCIYSELFALLGFCDKGKETKPNTYFGSASLLIFDFF